MDGWMREGEVGWGPEKTVLRRLTRYSKACQVIRGVVEKCPYY